jgi:hypothetical protein
MAILSSAPETLILLIQTLEKAHLGRGGLFIYPDAKNSSTAGDIRECSISKPATANLIFTYYVNPGRKNAPAHT